MPNPADARPLPGAVEALAALAGRVGRVAVVSGRPVAFLVEQLRLAGRVAGGLDLVGLYGLESVGPDGSVRVVPEAEQWRPVVEEAARRAAAEAPDGARIEPKGLSVTFHWREHPEAGEWALATAQQLAAQLGLAAVAARRSVELRPPVLVDKGTAVSALIEGFSSACFLGDDLGDLPAFAALDRMAAAGRSAVKVVASSDEVPAEVLATADVVVEGPEGALDFLASIGR